MESVVRWNCVSGIDVILKSSILKLCNDGALMFFKPIRNVSHPTLES